MVDAVTVLTGKIYVYVPSKGGWQETSATGSEYDIKSHAQSFVKSQDGWTEVRIYYGDPALVGHPSNVDWSES